MSGVDTTVTRSEKVPFGATLAEAYATLFRNLLPFAKIAAFPMLLYLLLPLVNFLIYPPLLLIANLVPAIYLVAPMQRGNFDLIIEWGLQLAALLLFTRHWMRFLTDSASTRGLDTRTLYFWSRGDLRLIRLTPLLMIDMLVVFALASLLYFARLQGLDDRLLSEGGSVMETIEIYQTFQLAFAVAVLLLASVAQLVVLGRCAPAFAAAAEGRPLSLRAAWRRTRGQTLRLAALWALLFWLPLQVIARLQGNIDSLYIDPRLLDFINTQWHRLSLGEIITWRLLQIPSAVLTFAVMALGAVLFLRFHEKGSDRQARLAERFD